MTGSCRPNPDCRINLQIQRKSIGRTNRARKRACSYVPTDGARRIQIDRGSGFKEWPLRLEGQPIFYPVTNELYAREITEQWNIRDSGIGYVFRFLVELSFVEKYNVEKVGGANHTEWWISAEKMDELNKAIVGKIGLIGKYPSDQ